jgi:hypothetical protein
MAQPRLNLSKKEFDWLSESDGVDFEIKLAWAKNYLGKHHLNRGLDKAKIEDYLTGKEAVRANADFYLFIKNMKAAYSQLKRRQKKASLTLSLKHSAATVIKAFAEHNKKSLAFIAEQFLYEYLLDQKLIGRFDTPFLSRPDLPDPRFDFDSLE